MIQPLSKVHLVANKPFRFKPQLSPISALKQLGGGLSPSIAWSQRSEMMWSYTQLSPSQWETESWAPVLTQMSIRGIMSWWRMGRVGILSPCSHAQGCKLVVWFLLGNIEGIKQKEEHTQAGTFGNSEWNRNSLPIIWPVRKRMRESRKSSGAKREESDAGILWQRFESYLH